MGLGKASPQMISAGMEVLTTRVRESVCVCKHFPTDLEGFESVKMIEAGHPIPDERSVMAATTFQKTLEGLRQEDLVILFLSGGGSALACLPAPGVSFEDLQAVTRMLLKNGATINEMNTVRKHLDLIKGGGLLRMASPARMAVLVLSDVVGSPLDTIASGPAVMDTSSYEEALRILEMYSGGEEVAEAITRHLKTGIESERLTRELEKPRSRLHTIR